MHIEPVRPRPQIEKADRIGESVRDLRPARRVEEGCPSVPGRRRARVVDLTGDAAFDDGDAADLGTGLWIERRRGFEAVTADPAVEFIDRYLQAERLWIH